MLVAAVVAAPLAVGGVHTGAAAGLVALLGAARFVAGQSGAVDGRRIRSIPSLAFWCLAGIALIQVLPMPGAVHEWLNPTGRAIHRAGREALFGEAAGGGPWRFLSLDPGRTVDRGLRWLALGIGAGLAAEGARRSEDWESACRIVLAAGVAVTVVGAAQAWTGSDRVLFLYDPSVAVPGFTTFVSDNHAATFAGLASLAGFYLAFRAPRRTALEGGLAAGAALALMVVMFEFGSAGTTLAFAVALGLFLTLFVGTRTAGELLPVRAVRRGVRTLGLGLVAAPAIVAAVWRFGPAGWRQWLWQSHVGQWLQQKAAIRLEMIRATLEATGDYWLLGAGGGATERVLAPYIDWSLVPPATIPTIENEPVEWLFQYGLPAGVIAAALLCGYAWFAYRRYRRQRRVRDAAGLSLALYLAVVAQFHFPFFALGIALPAVVLLETLAAPAGDGEAVDRAAGVDGQRGVIVTGPGTSRAVLACGLAAAVWFGAGHYLYAVDLEADDAPRQRSEREWRRLAALVPADGDLYMQAAFAAREAGDEEAAIRRAAFAFEREPKANIGVYVAHLYRSVGRTDRAREMYRRVFGGAYARVPGRWIRGYLIRDFPEPEEVAELVAGADERAWRSAARALRRERGSEVAVQFGTALQERRPGAFVAHAIVVRNYLRMDRAVLAETWLREMAEGAARTEAQRETRVELLARALYAQGKVEQAEGVCEELEGWLEKRACKNE